MFALHAVIEVADPNTVVNSHARVVCALRRRFPRLEARCVSCGVAPAIAIGKVKSVSSQAVSVLWSEDYCCKEFAVTLSNERDAEFDTELMKEFYPESEWRTWLEQQE